MTVPSPFAAPDTWDSLKIGGVSFTGTFEFAGDLIVKKLDHRHSAGRDGARIRDRGYDLARIKLRLDITEDRHFTELAALVRLLFPRDADTTRRAAYACSHPALALAGIAEIYASKLGALKPTDSGRWTVDVDLVEYRPDAQQTQSRSRTVQQRPDLGANRTAFTGVTAAPATPTPPSASTATTGPR